MDNFVTVITFSQFLDLAVPKARLEAEGIECRVKDELTVQVHPFYSQAIGGVKLQVKENDIPRAFEVLKEGGFIKEDLGEFKPKNKLDKATSKIPLLKELVFEVRVMMMVVILIAMIAILIHLATGTSTF